MEQVSRNVQPKIGRSFSSKKKRLTSDTTKSLRTGLDRGNKVEHAKQIFKINKTRKKSRLLHFIKESERVG